MAHRSRLGVVVIDCHGDDLEAAIRFWSGALGRDFGLDPDYPGFAASETPWDEPHVVLHRVEHASRVHLDIETEDRDAERARLAALGAWEVARPRDDLIVMEAPTGQRFCLVGPQRPDFTVAAREHT